MPDGRFCWHLNVLDPAPLRPSVRLNRIVYMWPFKRPKAAAAVQTPSKTPSLEQLSYDVAYFVLPHYAFKDLDKVIEMWTKTPSSTGPFFFLMACQMRKVDPDMNRATEFRSRYGGLPGIGRYYLLEHPKPSAIDLSNRDPMEIVEQGESFVLAPYFSAIIPQSESGDVMYYILGQSPIGGGTTLRCLTRDGINANLGPGPSPTAESFLAVVEHACTRKRT